MTKRSQRKVSIFEEGRRAKRNGVVKGDSAFKPYGRGLGLVWLAGYHSQGKKVHFPKSITAPVRKTQTEKNRAKRRRKELRRLYG